uniref:Alpha/beta hydrolase fold-3 domain-containing protein n=1 Tax=Oryza punctata TaxID=4537 RepID=A0A0E0LAH4_ORYPU
MEEEEPPAEQQPLLPRRRQRPSTLLPPVGSGGPCSLGQRRWQSLHPPPSAAVVPDPRHQSRRQPLLPLPAAAALTPSASHSCSPCSHSSYCLHHRQQQQFLLLPPSLTAAAGTEDDAAAFGVSCRTDEATTPSNPTFSVADGVASEDLHIDPNSSLSVRIILPTSPPHPHNLGFHPRHASEPPPATTNGGSAPYKRYLPQAISSPHIAASTRWRLPIIVQFHGGGFVFGSNSSATNDAFCRRVTKLYDAIIVAVGYMLATKSRYLIAFDGGVRVLRLVAVWTHLLSPRAPTADTLPFSCVDTDRRTSSSPRPAGLLPTHRPAQMKRRVRGGRERRGERQELPHTLTGATAPFSPLESAVLFLPVSPGSLRFFTDALCGDFTFFKSEPYKNNPSIIHHR